MKRFHVLWDRLRTDVWPVPLAMVVAGVLLFGLILEVDQLRSGDEVPSDRWWLHRGGGDDARHLMSTLVTSIITMSSVVFSITIVALSLAANQFGSRLVRTYIADIRTKFALGLFAMTIVYCLLALALLERDMTPAEVPHLAVTVGAILAVSCVFALLLFLHLVARSVVADEVIRRVGRELQESIAGLPPLREADVSAAEPALLPDEFDKRACRLHAPKEGYVQAVEHEPLVDIATAHDLVIRLDVRPGAFTAEGGTLGAIYPQRNVDPELVCTIQRHIIIGRRRTPTQDLEFSMRHIVDVALRALSPGINDANTALVVVDHLTGAFARLMQKALPATNHTDSTGTLRLALRHNSYRGLLDAALHQVRQAAAGQPAVVINLLGALGRIGEHARLREQVEALQRHAQMIAAAGLRSAEEANDAADISEALESTLRKLASVDQTR